jgi:hypothetical protein
MTRQITITVAGVQYTVDVDIERDHKDIVYHVTTPQLFKDELPERFDIVKPEDADQPRYDMQQFKGKGKEVAEAVWQQLRALAPQFKGGKEETRI